MRASSINRYLISLSLSLSLFYLSFNYLIINSNFFRTDNYDSDYGDSDYYSSTTLVPASAVSSSSGASSSAPNYLRSTYLYSKPTNIDDYTSSSTRPSTASTWRSSKYKNLEIEDDDILVTPRYGKYSTSSCKL